MSSALVLMNVLVPLKVMPGWPPYTFSPIHFIVLCFIGPLLVAALFAVIGKTPGWLRQRHASEQAAGLAEPADPARRDAAPADEVAEADRVAADQVAAGESGSSRQIQS
ncbi:hypothetical protein [Acidipropionibacterium jensenii]|nr:hypothetical protein [Acidipropionibacterium jensenii]QCV88509.1 hypothetical protein FEZ32_09205 [Acidipropionibacterium jensenii]